MPLFTGGLSVRNGDGMKEWEASITIEAAIIMSMAMLLFFVIMKLGLRCMTRREHLQGNYKRSNSKCGKAFYELERVRELF